MSGDTADGIVIDESSNTVYISRAYAAGVDRAWWAWTDAEAISRWWGPHGWAATVYEMDVRPGGRWRFEIAPVDGSAAPVRSIATYKVVVAHAELGYDDAFADEAWQSDGTGTFPTVVTFASAGAGCTVEVAASFPDGQSLRRAVELRMAEGYAEALDRLGDLLDARRSDHIVDDSRPAVPADYLEHLEALVAAGRRSEASEYFMTEMVRVPAEYLPMMKQDPSWDQMAKYAHTYAYDGRIWRGLQDGKPLPTDRWSIDAPIAVAVGGNGEAFIREGVNALAAILPNVTVLTLPGHGHSAFWAAPEPVARQARTFLLG